jgi:hypothetical protein
VSTGPFRKFSALCIALLSVACAERDRPPPLESAAGEPPAKQDGGLGVGDVNNAGDGAVLCGNQQIPAIVDRPNLYFVIDRSGSMADSFGPGGFSKYDSAQIALGSVLRALGHRLNYGAAVYPSLASAECGVGQELLPTTPGDGPEYGEVSQNGPVLARLLYALDLISPYGGTPTTPTLELLLPQITALSGKTYVVLMTDGAPNCNPDIRCKPDACIPNIEGVSLGEQACDANYNCCDPKNLGAGAQQSCVDADASESVIAKLAAAGVRTFVVGFRGAEAYTKLLDRMATAGQTARAETPKYYPAADAEALTRALRGIGSGIAISCDIELDQVPESASLVNVYLDTTLVAYDAIDGWSWTTNKSIRLNGAACSELSSGDIFRVQILAGCSTVVK